MSLPRPMPRWALLRFGLFWGLLLAGATVLRAAEDVAMGLPAAPASEPAAAEPAPPAGDAGTVINAIITALQGDDPQAPPPPPLPVPIGPAAAPVVAVPPAGDEQAAFGELVDILEGANDPNIRNLEANFHPQFQQLLYSELAFLRRVCKLDAPHFVDLAKTAQGQLRFAVREYATAINRPRQGGTIVASALSDPRILLQRRLSTLLEAKLGPEQAQRYHDECDKRTASRRRTVLLNLVATLDEQLGLTTEQRAQLLQSLSAKYQDAWDQWLQMLLNNAQCLPQVPDALIVPLLNAKQTVVWHQMPKQEFGPFMGVAFAQGGMAAQSEELQEIARIVAETPDE